MAIPIAEAAWLNIDGDGSGCNTLSGVFTIHEATFDPTGNVVSFAADAKQSCGDILGPTPLVARIRINSNVPPIVATPQSIAGLPQEVYEHTLVTLDGSQSYESASQITAWKWSQASGPAVIIESPSTAVTRFRAPEVAPGGADVVLQLDVTDASGQHATNTIPVHIFDKRDRRTWLTWRSPQGDYIGGGKPLSFSLADGNALIGASQRLVVGFSGDSSNSWSLEFAGSNGAALTLGTYTDAQRYPFQTAGHPGMDVSGSGRGCNTLSGQFSVLEIDSPTSPQRFAARFVQSCETTESPLRGTVLFNAIAPGNPVARMVGPTHALPGTEVTLDGTGSSSSASALVRYWWRQVSGPIVATSDPTQPTLRFIMPAISATVASLAQAAPQESDAPAATPTAPLLFELEVDDEDGLVDVSTLAISIDAPAPPASPVAAPVLGERLLLLLGTAFAMIGLFRLREDPRRRPKREARQ